MTYKIKIWKFRDFEQLPEFQVLETKASTPEELEKRLLNLKKLLLASGCEAVEYQII